MTQARYKKILIALLLLAFTSQSFAALVMPCQFASQTSMTMDMDMSDMAAMDHAGMADMDHSGMHHSDQPSTTGAGDCCKTMGHCGSGTCSWVFFGHFFDAPMFSLSSEVNAAYADVIPERLASSLFKPPIFR
ncbi:hypothetical protein [Cellvibrio sp.]|uniref:hypothetical protein n=1 Tax=Cellvibrio sp. TaxID=1965322 RepID=UPI00396489F0